MDIREIKTQEMDKDCFNCQHFDTPTSQLPCVDCIDRDKWEMWDIDQPSQCTRCPEEISAMKWKPVTEPPEFSVLVLIAFEEWFDGRHVSTGAYHHLDKTWEIVDPVMKNFTPAFYICKKDLNLPDHD